MIVRFEMMYNCWCEGCKLHIGKGVRFNAEKKAVGKYHSTTIWELRMKCTACSQRFVIRTDPEHRDYEFVSGAKRKLEAFEAEDNETVKLLDEDARQKLLNDPILRMEHQEHDKQRAEAAAPRLQRLQQWSDSLRERDADANATLRRHFRTAKKELRKRERESKAKGLGMTLLPASEADAEEARRMRFARDSEGSAARDAKMRRLAARARPVFPGTRASADAEARLSAVRKLHSRGVDRGTLKLSRPAKGPAGDWGGIFGGGKGGKGGTGPAARAPPAARLRPRRVSARADG